MRILVSVLDCVLDQTLSDLSKGKENFIESCHSDSNKNSSSDSGDVVAASTHNWIFQGY